MRCADVRRVSKTSRVRVTHLIHDLGRGGAEHLLVDLATVAVAAGIDMSVVSMLPTERSRYACLLEDSGVPVASLDLTSWWDPRGLRRLRRLLPELDAQVLHSHLKHADVVAGRVAQAAGIPHVSTLHVVEDSVGLLGAWKRGVAMRRRKRTAQRTIAVSDALRSWYLAVSGADPATVVTIRNGVPDPGVFERADVLASRRELGIDEKRVVVASVAVMRSGKGHDVLLDAITRIDDDRLVFVLAGDGSEAPSLRARAAGDSRILFTGFREDVPRLLAAADLAVHPTRGDALPTALIHALAAGLPIVASDVGGVGEIVSSGAGVLVPPGDAAALAEAVVEIAADDGERRLMGKRARRRFEDEFEATAWAERLRSLYAEVLSRG